MKLGGFDFWELRFDGEGKSQGGADELLAEARAKDLFVFSHGWNNDRPRALRLYELFFGEMAKQLRGMEGIATAGVVWPSMRWPDEPDPEAPADGGGAAALGGGPADGEVVGELKAVFPDDEDVLDELAALLDERPEDEAALARFKALVAELTTGPDALADEEDDQERAILEAEPRELFRSSARVATARGGGRGGATAIDEGGAAGIGDSFGRLWDGAKLVLRQATYWEMKKRAGHVGGRGLGPLLRRLHERAPDVRIHLIGHSFGARVVSFSLLGLGDDPPTPSPVKSLFLLQGAFSHYAFAASLPHDPGRGGALNGMQERVDGPLLVTHSVHDHAVGRLYPVASLAQGQDAAGVDEWMARWGAIGHDGAQAVNAVSVPLGPAGHAYDLRRSAFVNLNGDDVIKTGRPPSGAHSDLFHPELAWAALAAAGLTGRRA